MMKCRLICCIIVSCGMVAGIAAQESPRRRSPAPRLASWADRFGPVVRGMAESVVEIVDADDNTLALGTVVDRRGLILTKASTTEGTIRCVIDGGDTVAARRVAISTKYDLALVRIARNDLEPVKWSPKPGLNVGRWMISAGLGRRPLAVGIVSVGPRRIPGRSAFLGVSIEDAPKGVRIVQVQPNTAAEKHGLQVDDVVTRIDKTVVEDRESFVEAIGAHDPGDKITLDILRADATIRIVAELGRRRSLTGRGRFSRNRWRSRRLSRRRFGFPRAVQHDSVIKPSECGGPVLDIRGRVVGINIARADRTHSFAIPSDDVRKVLAELMRESRASK